MFTISVLSPCCEIQTHVSMEKIKASECLGRFVSSIFRYKPFQDEYLPVP